jgi:hypothetical protein
MGLTTARAAEAGAALALADVHENAVRSEVEELVVLSDSPILLVVLQKLDDYFQIP